MALRLADSAQTEKDAALAKCSALTRDVAQCNMTIQRLENQLRTANANVEQLRAAVAQRTPRNAGAAAAPTPTPTPTPAAGSAAAFRPPSTPVSSRAAGRATGHSAMGRPFVGTMQVGASPIVPRVLEPSLAAAAVSPDATNTSSATAYLTPPQRPPPILDAHHEALQEVDDTATTLGRARP